MKPKLKRHISRILPFGIIFLVLGWVFLWTEFAVIYPLGNYGIEEAIKITPKIVVFASASIFCVGCFIGFIEVAIINKYFIARSFKQKIILKSLLYLLLIFSIVFVFYNLAAAIEMQESVFSKAVFDRYINFLFSMTNLSTMLQLSFSIVVSLLFFEINENLGRNVLQNFFTGKYHKPILEQRVFLFIDMKDSTTIAEKLGHEVYFEFLKAYYNDLSDSIIQNNGEVYQYIGDEVVISWAVKKQNTKRDALKSFFDMKMSLTKKREWYKTHYNLYPEFKGAIHAGEVTIGEIGALKKDIFFTGDVLNTTSRLQSLCNSYQAELLISEDVYARVESTEGFQFTFEDEVMLRGKSKPVKIYAVTTND